MSFGGKLAGRVVFLIFAIMLLGSISGGMKNVSAFVPNTRLFATYAKQMMHRKAHQGSCSGVRVRFAPSPTGSLHVGGARTALFNWLLARRNNGKFVVRVEDTDEARSTRASEASILSDLKWLGLNWDEGPEIGGPHAPYRQSERKEIYSKYAEQLIENGHAYRCFCTEEELEAKKKEAEANGLEPRYDGTWRDADPAEVKRRLDAGEPYTVRFRVPDNKIVSFVDIVRDHITWDASAMLGDFVLLRSSGMPVYNFCVAVDDASMGITHVVRAEEHLSNTLRQLLILEALGRSPPTYAHCSLILGSDRSKLSKRHGATSLSAFAEQGFLPSAMMNYLANLGWSDGTNKEIFTPNELIDAFNLSRIVKGAAIFDMDKLRWVNGQHIRMSSIEDLKPLVMTYLRKANQTMPFNLAFTEPLILEDYSAVTDQEFFNLATKLSQRDVEILSQSSLVVASCLYFPFQDTISNTTAADVAEVLNSSFANFVNTIISDYDSQAFPDPTAPDFDKLWKEYVKSLGQRLQLKGKHLYHPLRLALTGRMSGPELVDQLRLITLAPGKVNPSFPVIGIPQRIIQLKEFVQNTKSI